MNRESAKRIALDKCLQYRKAPFFFPKVRLTYKVWLRPNYTRGHVRRLHIEICTPRNTFAVTFLGRYCGATGQTRYYRHGEEWLRGNDLRDGKWYEFPKVLWDVLCYEFCWGRWKRRPAAFPFLALSAPGPRRVV